MIDSDKREINWLVKAEEQARRRKEWEASGKNQLKVRRGILYKYARDVAVNYYLAFDRDLLMLTRFACSPRTSGPTRTEKTLFLSTR